MSQTQVRPETEGEQRPHPRRRVGFKAVGIVCAVALVAVGAYALWNWVNATPQPYGGTATANDVLMTVGASASGGVWATGVRYDRALTTPGARPVSSFILRLEQGKWVTVKTLDARLFVVINSAAMVSQDEGWAVGSVTTGSLILHDQHGVWTDEPTHLPGMLSAITMVSPTEGWAVGGNPGLGGASLILHYRNDAWTKVPSPAGMTLGSIAMSSPTEGWAAGVTTDNTFTPVLLRYADGAWTRVALQSQGVNAGDTGQRGISSLAMTPAGAGWAVGSGGTILRESGGAWTLVNSPTGFVLNSVALTPSGDGWAVGGNLQGETGVILHDTNGSWVRVAAPTSEHLLGVVAVSDSEAWAVGTHGVILHYTGGSWRLVNGPA